MKALVFHGDNDLRYEDVPTPAYGPDEVLVKVKAVGICGSDVAGYQGKTGRRTPPMIMGHEFAGVVEYAGVNVSGVKAGDQVVVYPYTSCGTCVSCTKGMSNACSHKQFFGVFTINGAMAEYVSVRSDLLYPLPAGADLRHGAMAEPLSVALRCVEKAAITKDSTVTIVGAGTIGLMCLLLIKIRQPRTIAVLDISDERLELARDLGADITINPAKENPSEVIAARFPSGGTSVVIEAVGIENTLSQAVALAERGGRISVVGMSQRMIPVDMHEVIGKELQIISSFQYDRRQFEHVLASLPALKADLDRVISHSKPLRQGVEMYERLAKAEPGLIKVILTDQA